MYFLLKVLISAVIVAAVSELARRFSAVAAVVASLPLTSLLAIVWLWHDTRDGRQVAALAGNIFWALLPSLLFFVVFPFLLRAGWRFGPALLISVLVMLAGYAAYLWLLGRFGIRL